MVGVLFFYLFFEGLGIEKVTFLKGPTFNNSTTLQCFSLFFTFSKNHDFHQFWSNFGSLLASILEGFEGLEAIFEGFLGGQKNNEKSRSADGPGRTLDLARSPTETPHIRARLSNNYLKSVRFEGHSLKAWVEIWIVGLVIGGLEEKLKKN